jgi:hypothetical protein
VYGIPWPTLCPLATVSEALVDGDCLRREIPANKVGLRQKRAIIARSATPSTGPITTPAVAPGDKPWLFPATAEVVGLAIHEAVLST